MRSTANRNKEVGLTPEQFHKSPAITDLREFNDWGHSLTIDHGWREIADQVLGWLGQRVT